MPDPDIAPRKGQAPGRLERAEFARRFRRAFFDPAFAAESDAIARLEEIAWQAYQDGRKAPVNDRAGPGFADPDYQLSREWRETHDRLQRLEQARNAPETPLTVLVVCGSPRNDGTCPGEVSKTWRLAQTVREELRELGARESFLDLSLLTSEYGKRIHPCKACVSTAMPLCHWPCSCYPNHSLDQTDDWMAEIYGEWVAAHGVVLLTPVHWYQASSAMKLMIDRLVCADGGNPDPTSTGGKDAEKAKRLELQGWHYPKHLAGRAYGVIAHGDVAGAGAVRRALCDWLDWMGLVDAGAQSRLDRYIGYYRPYATSHAELDDETALFEEARNVARAVFRAATDLRAGALVPPDSGLKQPRTK